MCPIAFALIATVEFSTSAGNWHDYTRVYSKIINVGDLNINAIGGTRF